MTGFRFTGLESEFVTYQITYVLSCNKQLKDSQSMALTPYSRIPRYVQPHVSSPILRGIFVSPYMHVQSVQLYNGN
jgi:hypothetical protein